MIFHPSLVNILLTDETTTPAAYVKVPVSIEFVHQMGKDALWMAFNEAYRIATGGDWDE